MKKKRPKQTAWEETVKPELPSLAMAKFGGGVYSDEERVEEASKHLLELLKNPYYYEAYQRLHKVLPGRRPGQLPMKGAKARELQTPDPKPSRPAHHERKDKVRELIVRYVDNNRLLPQVGAFKKKRQIDICLELVDSHRELIQEMWPDIRDPKKLAKKLSEDVSNYRRGRS